MAKLQILKLYPDVTTPFKSSEFAACYDLKAYFKEGDKIACTSKYRIGTELTAILIPDVDEPTISLEAGDTALIPTGLKVAIEQGYYMSIKPRSGNSAKLNIIIPNSPGTIDSDYRGEIKIIINNNGDKPLFISSGMKLAQFELLKEVSVEIELVDKLDETARGTGGFGSTGN